MAETTEGLGYPLEMVYVPSARTEAFVMMRKAGIPVEEIERILARDPRMEAAERLARLVLRNGETAHEYGGLKIRLCDQADWDEMHGLARKVLGEK